MGYDREGRVIPVYATYNVNFPEDADYVWTDFAGTSRKGIKATEIGEVDNLITAYGVKNAIDVVNNSFNDVNNSFNDVSNSFNDVNNSFNSVNNNIETEISKLAENFDTDNLSANNAVTNNLDVSDITIEKTAGDDGQVIGKADGKVKWTNAVDFVSKGILDIMWPIGVVYTQYPQQKSPQELFPDTTWEEVNYDGAFFRASGGKAAAFNGGKQAGENLSHRHPFTPKGTIDSASLVGEIGVTARYLLNESDMVKYAPGTTYHWTVKGGDQGPTDRVVRIDVSHAHNFYGSADSTDYRGGSECRPDNYTIRIWKRTA